MKNSELWFFDAAHALARDEGEYSVVGLLDDIRKIVRLANQPDKLSQNRARKAIRDLVPAPKTARRRNPLPSIVDDLL